MTENEAIKNVTAYVYMECENMPMQVVKALDIMKNCTKEIQPYRAIGTVEEFKDLKEKNEPKKPIQDEHFEHDYICSCCGGKLAESVDDNCCLEEEMAGWCPYCGQKLDWSE